MLNLKKFIVPSEAQNLFVGEGGVKVAVSLMNDETLLRVLHEAVEEKDRRIALGLPSEDMNTVVRILSTEFAWRGLTD